MAKLNLGERRNLMEHQESTEPTLATIREAAQRIQPYIHRTPILHSESINRLTGCRIVFKCENLQKVGAFKMRGASNAVFLLPAKQAANGVVTHSSGNHGAALALAARHRNIPAYIVMPEDTAQVKKEAVQGYGAQITYCKPTLQAREETAGKLLQEHHATLIHPYNDFHIIAGQGTAALEFLEECPDLDLLLTPVGGGGLISGTAITTSALATKTRVIGAEPAGADDAYHSFRQGKLVPCLHPKTIADGLRASLGEHTFCIIKKYVHDIARVDEEHIIAAMRLVWERMKIVIEPSSAVPVAAILANPSLGRGKRVGIILSGGNVSLDQLPWNSK